MKTARVKFVIVEPELLPTLLEAISSSPDILDLSNIFVFNTRGQVIPKGFKSWEWLLQHGEEDWVCFDDLKQCMDTEVSRLSTSGTTGMPKVAIQSHYNATSWCGKSRRI
jgi:4-coumarate--CoA ligase